MRRENHLPMRLWAGAECVQNRGPPKLQRVVKECRTYGFDQRQRVPVAAAAQAEQALIGRKSRGQPQELFVVEKIVPQLNEAESGPELSFDPPQHCIEIGVGVQSDGDSGSA
jgi:hypothetical protein